MDVAMDVVFASGVHESLQVTTNGRPGDSVGGWLDARIVLKTADFAAVLEHAALRVEDWASFRDGLESLARGAAVSVASDFLEPWLEIRLSRKGMAVEIRGALLPSSAGVARVDFVFDLAEGSLGPLLDQVDALVSGYQTA